ncbi:MAG TPA: sugar ABC transporter ATP-binding protein [Tepidisphaeraceae bacterium]|nr:sugar ABC transporter ATP-binding protein [Tepidisphaeraceae bacterium]
MSETPLLQMRGIRKEFLGVRALDGVDFTVQRGQIHALMGENGAGKSTLIKVLTGAYHRDGGETLLDGQPIDPRTPLQAQQLGISTVYQEVNLVPELTVAENIMLGRQPTRFGMIRWGEVNRRAREAMRRLDLDIDVTRSLSSYSIALQQMVAIARALDVQAKMLILDEPTSSLDADEVKRLFAMMKRLRDEGLGIVFITHFMDQVYAVSDRITVLRNGRLVGEYEASSLPRVELVAKMMGKELAELDYGRAHQREAIHKSTKDEVLHVTGLGRKGSIAPFELQVHEGETIGLAGLLGSGRTEVARLLFGIDQSDQGQMSVNGQAVRFKSPRDAVKQGFGMCPEDRKTQAIIPDLSIRENIILAMQANQGWLRFISKSKQLELADQYIKALNIAAYSAEQPIKNLSGGNQQKVILARWLAMNPKFLILDEPTRGIDVGAKAEIQKLIVSLAAGGRAVMFISSELEEVVRCSNRVAVLRDRQKVCELSGDDIDERNIMHAIAKGGLYDGN